MLGKWSWRNSIEKKAEKAGTWDGQSKHVICSNNLYSREGLMPSSVYLPNAATGGKNAIVGEPGFLDEGSEDPTMYVPTNAAVVQGRGVQIYRLGNDPEEGGLVNCWGEVSMSTISLDVTVDFLGNPVDPASPGIGAIEAQ